MYACTHLANSGSLLLPVSNLTNLLAFAASGLAFGRFAALMALPWLAVIGVEYVVFGRFFRSDLSPGSAGAQRAPGDDPHAVLLAGQPGWARTGCQPMTLAENLPSLLRADISLT